MKLYTAIHQHRFGTTVYLFRTEIDPEKATTLLINKILKTFQVDFEPERDETIEIIKVDDKIPVII